MRLYAVLTLMLLTGCNSVGEQTAAEVDSCAFANMTYSGSSTADASKRKYTCSFKSPGGTPSGTYDFYFYSNATADSVLMTDPTFTTFDTEYDKDTCTLYLNISGVRKFDLTKPTLSSTGALASFHHHCIYCGSHEDVTCTLAH